MSFAIRHEQVQLKNKRPTWCPLLFYFISYVHNFSLQHEYHSNQTIPKLQHTSNQEQYDQCGNSTE